MTAPTAARPAAGRGPDPAAITTAAEFAAALTELRLHAGLSIRELPRATGIDASSRFPGASTAACTGLYRVGVVRIGVPADGARVASRP